MQKNINSLLQSGEPLDIIVVDNASTDDTVQVLENFPEVDLIKSDLNLGFGKANNIGIQKALEKGAEFVFLFNQDAWVYGDAVLSLIKIMQGNPEFGILSPLHLSPDEKTLDQNFATYYNRKTNVTKSGIAEVPFVNAAAWMVSKSCLEKVGYFEPMFSHYGEDRNFCDRVLYHGFKIGITDQAKICHDRIITRNQKKDLLQSKYKILNAFLNVNHSFFKASLNAMREVVGLPKYFAKSYGLVFAFKLLLQLKFYYLKTIFNFNEIIAIKAASKRGENGKFKS